MTVLASNALLKSLSSKSSSLSSTLPYNILETIANTNNITNADTSGEHLSLVSLLSLANQLPTKYNNNDNSNDHCYQFIITIICKKFGFWNFLQADTNTNTNTNTNNTNNTNANDAHFQAIGITIINEMMMLISQLNEVSTLTSSSSSSSSSSLYKHFNSINIGTSEPSSSSSSSTSVHSNEKNIISIFKVFWKKTLSSSSSTSLNKIVKSIMKVTTHIKVAIAGDFDMKGNDTNEIINIKLMLLLLFRF
jgi:hypothetical protein